MNETASSEKCRIKTDLILFVIPIRIQNSLESRPLPVAVSFKYRRPKDVHNANESSNDISFSETAVWETHNGNKS